MTCCGKGNYDDMIDEDGINQEPSDEDIENWDEEEMYYDEEEEE